MQRALPEQDSCVDWLESIMYRDGACHLDSKVANRLIALSHNGMAKTTAVEIGRAIHVSDRTVRAVLSRLSKEGFIFASKVDRRTNLRTIKLNVPGSGHYDHNEEIINTSSHINGSPSLNPSISKTGAKAEDLPVNWLPSDWFDVLEAWGCLHLLPTIDPSLRRKWGQVFKRLEPSKVSADSLRGGCTAKNAIVVALEELFVWEGETPTVKRKHSRIDASWGGCGNINTSGCTDSSASYPESQKDNTSPQSPQTSQSTTHGSIQGHGQPQPTQSPQNVPLSAEKEEEWDDFLSQFGEKVSNAKYIMRQNWPLFVDFVNTYSPSQLNPPFVESLKSDSLNRKMSYLCKQLSRRPDGSLKVEKIVLKRKPKVTKRPAHHIVTPKQEEQAAPPTPEQLEMLARLARGEQISRPQPTAPTDDTPVKPKEEPPTLSVDPQGGRAPMREKDLSDGHSTPKAAEEPKAPTAPKSVSPSGDEASASPPGGRAETPRGNASATRTFDRGRIDQMLRERFLSGAPSVDLEGDS